MSGLNPSGLGVSRTFNQTTHKSVNDVRYISTGDDAKAVLNGLSTGTTAVFRPGTHTVEAGLDTPANATVVIPHDATIIPDSDAGTFWVTRQNTTITGGGTIDASGIESAGGHTIYLQTGGTTIEGISIVGSPGKDGIYIEDGDGHRIDSVDVSNTDRHGLTVISGSNITFSDCRASGCVHSGFAAEPNNTGEQLDNIRYSDCIGDGNTKYGAYVNTQSLSSSDPAVVTFSNLITRGNTEHGFVTARVTAGSPRIVKVDGLFSEGNGFDGWYIGSGGPVYARDVQLWNNGQGSGGATYNVGFWAENNEGANPEVYIRGFDARDTQGTPTQERAGYLYDGTVEIKDGRIGAHASADKVYNLGGTLRYDDLLSESGVDPVNGPANSEGPEAAIKVVRQASQPTPPHGVVYLWEDTDAGAGNPIYHLVTNDSGTVASEPFDSPTA